MSVTIQHNIANSFEMAWDYLEAADQIDNPDLVASHLLDVIETLIRHGERRPLLLANKAIASYQRLRDERTFPS